MTDPAAEFGINVLGLMSGTSLDGLDIALCHFRKNKDRWEYEILKAETMEYSQDWRDNLSDIEMRSALEFAFLHKRYGDLLGQNVNEFLEKHQVTADLIASHGHTIFHQPAYGLTFQIGDGACIAARTNLPVVCDFRSTDVALGGQGAPLVPIGDALLFGEYDACLNLGGFCNISFSKAGRRIAFDISPCNIVLNEFAAHYGEPFDDKGLFAASGTCIPGLRSALNELEYYALQAPKSLGREWVSSTFLPILQNYPGPIEDILRTLCEHISDQVANTCNTLDRGKLLISGGGTRNDFLVSLLHQKVRHQVIVPDAATIDFKEALIFAFLGFLRFHGEINVLSSVTGSRQNHSAGALYLPPDSDQGH